MASSAVDGSLLGSNIENAEKIPVSGSLSWIPDVGDKGLDKRGIYSSIKLMFQFWSHSYFTTWKRSL